jgi:tetratricopeptide (TPR) repeat protein
MRKSPLIGLIVAIAGFTVLTAPVWADYKQAVAYYNQGRFNEAIQELKPDLDRNPDWETGHRLLGLCYLRLNNNALAVSSLSRAVVLKSPAFATYYGLGEAYFKMEKYDNCITALNQGEPLASKERDPEREKSRLYHLRGSAYYRLGRWSEAADDFINTIRSNQADWTDYLMLGDCYYKLNRTNEAIQALEKVQSMKPGQSTTADLLGKAYFKKGVATLSEKQYQPAVQNLLKAKDYDPKNGYIYYNLAEAYLFEKKYPDAEKALAQAIDLLPRNPDVYGRMGLVYEKQKKWDLALTAYKKADEIAPAKWFKDAIARVNENKKK